MNTSQYRFTLDLQSTQSQVCIPVTRGDTARTWLISFRDGSSTYKITDGCLAKLEILRPTGTHIEEFCPIENNATVRYSFSQNKNTAAVEGFHECAVVLYDEEGQIIGSPRFCMIVSDRVVSVDTIPLSDENKLIIDSIIPEEISRRNAETERINAEAERTASETQRTLNEAARQTADTERSLAEENRNKRFETLQKEINTAAATLVSPTVTVTPTENGHQVTVMDHKGEHMFNIMDGKDGKQGIQGPSGKTAYQYAHETGYTGTEENYADDMNPDALKNQLNDYLVTELAKRGQLKPEFANDISECTDTSKLYVLTDGTYWAYMKKIMPEIVTPNFTDVFDANTWYKDHRLNSSNEPTSGSAGQMVSAVIPLNLTTEQIQTGAYIYLQGGNANQSSAKIVFRNASGGVTFIQTQGSGMIVEVVDDKTQRIKIGATQSNDAQYFASAQFSFKYTGMVEDIIATVNQPITYTITPETVTQGWNSTGYALNQPANYENRIIDLETDMEAVNLDMARAKSKLELIDGLGSVSVPDHWKSTVKDKTEIVKALQTEGGKDCVSFVWASDTHIPDNYTGRTNDLGKVMAKMLDNCEIPFAVVTGDINTRASYDTEKELLQAQQEMPNHLSPLWRTERLLMALGNHDGVWGDSTCYHLRQHSPQKLWQTYFRGQALDFRRVFSDDGLYFYVDNVAQKTRFIVLNSQFGGEYAVDENGYAVNNRFSTSCYGQTQLGWLADVALDMPSGYSAIITAHVPPNVEYTVDKAQFIGIVNAYNNKTTYSGSYADVDGWTSNHISVDFTGAKGEIIAIFAGHVHWDKIDTTTMSCPIITIISAGSSANEWDIPEGAVSPIRTFGTNTETSFDVVTINKNTRKIYCTRVGAGTDREINY